MITAFNDLILRAGLSVGLTGVPQIGPCERLRLPHSIREDIYFGGSTIAILRLLNSMPLFCTDDTPRSVTDVVQNLLSTSDSYNVIRYGMSDRSTPGVELTSNTEFLLRLAWAVTLRLFQSAWQSGNVGEHP